MGTTSTYVRQTMDERIRYEPDSTVKRLAIMIFLLILAAVLGGLGAGVKIRPGGTAISLSGDVLPCLIMIKLLVTDWIYLRHGPIWIRISTAIIFLVFAGIVGWRVSDSYAFHYHPFSRGSLFGI